jgi:hypothetical protein
MRAFPVSFRKYCKYSINHGNKFSGKLSKAPITEVDFTRFPSMPLS